MYIKCLSFIFFVVALLFSPLFAQHPPSLLPGFPIIIDSLNFAASQPVLADLDEDGKEDIIVSKNSPPFLIFAYNINGQVLDGWPQPVNQGTFALAAGDVDGDGHTDVVARTTYSIYAFNRFGNLMPGFPQRFATAWDNLGRRKMALYDLHNHNTLDIITATYNRVLVYHSDGSLHPGWPRNLPGKNALYPTVGDLNLDGEAEIVICSYRTNTQTRNDSGWIFVLSQDGNDLPGWPKLLDSNYTLFNSASLANTNDDDSLEIIIASNHHITDGTSISKISIYSPSGILLKQWYNPRPPDYIAFGDIAIGDINRNSSLELAVSDRLYNTYLFDTDGEPFPGWPQFIEGHAYFPPILADINNDSIPELFMGYFASPQDTGKYYVFNVSGQQLPCSPFKVYGNTGVDVPIFSDMDNNGSMEMVFISAILDGASGYALSAYSFPGAQFTKEGSPWPQLEHDRHNTFQYGYIPSDNVVSVPSFERTPLQFSLLQNYPNPFNPKTAIGFSLLAVSNVTLKVYDILGKEVATLIHSRLMDAGKHEVNFDGSDVPSGIYYYRLTAGKFTETKKFVVVR